MAHKPTIYEALRTKLGRNPTNAELKTDVARIKEEALIEAATKGRLAHQRPARRGSRKRGLQGSKDTHRRIFEGHIDEAERHMRNARYAIANQACDRAYIALTKMWGSIGIAKSNAEDAHQRLRYEGRMGDRGFRGTTREFISACVRPTMIPGLSGPRKRRRR